MSTEKTSLSDPTLLCELRMKTLHLFNTNLSEHSIKEMSDSLQKLNQSCFYLEMAAGPLWALVDQQRLHGAANVARTQVELLLALLDMLLEEIICTRQELQAFLVCCEQGTVDAHLVKTTQHTLSRIYDYIKDFHTRPAVSLGPLELDNHLIPNHGNTPMPQIMVSVCPKPPVMFDRAQSYVKATTVVLVWGFSDEKDQEPNPQFEIIVKALHPSVAEHGEYSTYLTQAYCCTLEHLTADCTYQFSVKRPDVYTLVYTRWMDTITFTTSAL